MKKYLLGLVAVVLAIGFSAFTNARIERKPTSGMYYWYPVDEFGQTTGAAIDNAHLRDKTFAEQNFTSCTDVVDKPYCLLGSDVNNLTTGSLITPSGSDDTILRTN